MSRLGINTGSNPNDGQGDPLRIAMGKINSNFTEIYNTFGDGYNLVSYANTAGISTLAQNLTGSPRINVSGILNTGITTTEHLEVRNITSTGIITAVQFVGDGSQLENVIATSSGVEVLDENVRKGVAKELNFGEGLFCSGPDGVGRVTIAVTTSVVSGGGTGGSTPLEFRNQNTILGEYSKVNFGNNLFASVNPVTGVVTVTTSGVSTFNTVVVGGSNTSLVVNGNARITGILTIGTSSLTLDGNNNQIKIGTGVTIKETGGASFSEGINIVGVVTATSFKGSGSQLTGVITSLVGYATEGYVTNTLVGYATTSYVNSLTLDQLSNVNVGAPSTGQVLKWSGSQWQASADLTAAGVGIGLSDLSVTINPSGINSLTYNNNTGVFLFTPTNLVGYATQGYVTNALVGYATQGYVTNSLVGYATQGYVTNALVGYATTGSIVGFITSGVLTSYATTSYVNSLTLDQLSNVNVGAPSTGQVLKWSGTEWEAASDLTASGGAGIGLSDLSVTINAAGINSLTYNNTTGVFLFTPTNLVGYATEGYVTNSLVGYATQGYVSNASVAFASTSGYATIAGYSTSSGVSTSASTSGYATTAGIATVAQGLTGTPNLNVGVVTATAFTGNLTGTATTAATVDILNTNGLTTIYYPTFVEDRTDGQILRGDVDLTYRTDDNILSVPKISSTEVTATTFIGNGSQLTGVITSLVGYATQGYVTTQIGLNTFTGAASTITSGQISNWNTAYGWGNHASAGYLTNVNITAGSNITVLETSEGNFIITSTSIAGAGGTWAVNSAGIHTSKNVGIGTTLSSSTLTVEGDGRFSGVVTATSFSGSASGLTGVPAGQLTGALPALDGSALTGIVASGTGVVIREEGTIIGTAGTINFVGTGVTATFSSGIATVSITASGGGSIAGIDTTGTSFFNDLNISGVVTATRFESSSAGTPTIDSPNNLNINAATVAISTDATVGRELRISGITTVNAGGVRVAGVVTATSFVGDGSLLTNLPGGGITGINTSGTSTFNNLNVTGVTTSTGGFVGNVTGNATGLSGTPNITVGTIGATSLNASGIVTATSFRSTTTTGDGTDVGFAIKYYITSSGASAYRFAGPGLVNSTNNPTLYLHRGFTYIFENSTGGSHPFAIRYSSGGTGYGSTYLSGSQSGTQIFTVPFDAPNTLVYQCTIHGGMVGTFNIVT